MNTEAVAEGFEDLETFQHKNFRRSKGLYCTIRNPFLLSFSNDMGALAKDNTHVLLSYSKLNNAIGIQFVKHFDADHPGAMKLSRPPSKNASISVGGFFKVFNLDITKFCGRYLPVCLERPGKETCWVIFLKQRRRKNE